MSKFTVRILTAVFTFTIGVAIATAWVFNHTEEPGMAPVALSSDRPAMEMVFVLDTTGSMGGLLSGAKQRIWGIINEVMQTSSLSSVKVGLVAYRDREDQYITQVLPLTEDLDKVYSTLMDYEAAGGGDEPENVRRALAEGVAKAGWSQPSANTAQILFLVGDAPPHDYADEPDTLTTADLAVKQGITVNTIQCGTSAATKQVWEAIARRGQGQYFLIPLNGGVQTISTPYDEQLSQLGTRLGGTYLAYGGGAGAEGDSYRVLRKEMADSVESSIATRSAPSAAAERSVNKALNSKAYIGDLLQDIENGSTNLESVKSEDLPSQLQKLSAEERTKDIERRLAERSEIRKQILSLSKQRIEYIAAEQKKRNGGAQNGFDDAVSTALRQQVAKKGIRYGRRAQHPLLRAGGRAYEKARSTFIAHARHYARHLLHHQKICRRGRHVYEPTAPYAWRPHLALQLAWGGENKLISIMVQHRVRIIGSTKNLSFVFSKVAATKEFRGFYIRSCYYHPL